jgi:hypothetical protein
MTFFFHLQDAEMFSLKCSGSNCKAMIPSDERANQPCSSCQFVPPNDPSLLSHYIKFLDTFAQNLTKSLSQQALSDLLAEAKEILHPTNPLLATLYADVGRHQTDNQPGGYFSQAVQIYKSVFVLSFFSVLLSCFLPDFGCHYQQWIP